MDPSPGREELLLLSRQPRAWKSHPFPAAALSSTTRWGRGPRWPPRALDWGRRGLCSPRGVAWSGTSPRAQGWGHEATAEPCWGRLPCAGRGERARKAAPRPRLRLRGLANASVAWFSAAQPPGSPTLARRVPAHTRTRSAERRALSRTRAHVRTRLATPPRRTLARGITLVRTHAHAGLVTPPRGVSGRLGRSLPPALAHTQGFLCSLPHAHTHPHSHRQHHTSLFSLAHVAGYTAPRTSLRGSEAVPRCGPGPDSAGASCPLGLTAPWAPGLGTAPPFSSWSPCPV